MAKNFFLNDIYAVSGLLEYKKSIRILPESDSLISLVIGARTGVIGEDEIFKQSKNVIDWFE